MDRGRSLDMYARNYELIDLYEEVRILREQKGDLYDELREEAVTQVEEGKEANETEWDWVVV